MTTTLTFSEGQHTAGWLLSELSQYGSRTTRTVKSGQVLVTGTVIGRTMVGGTATATAQAGNTGNGAMGAITVTGPAVVGRHRLEFTTSGANVGGFTVTDPYNKVIGAGTVAVAFSSGGLAFTLADGATDFVVGDTIFIDVVGTEQVVVADPTATDGSDIARGIIFDSIDATSAAHAGAVIIERMAEVRTSLLSSAAPALGIGFQSVITWGAGYTTDALKAVAAAQLLALGISIRS